MGSGLLSFVGMGPGDPALRTARAADRLERAEVVVGPGEVPPVAALVELVRAGKRVVWAVPGDVFDSPDVVQAVREAARSGVPFEVVPGVAAQGAAAAFAGVLGPVVRTGPGEVEAATTDRAPNAQMTLIADLGEPTQRTTRTTAPRAAEDAARLLAPEDGAATPASAGELVLAFGVPEEPLRWFERRPLFGKRVLVTRARGQATGTAALLRDHGAEPVVIPTIVIQPPSDPEPLRRALAALRSGAYAWAAFTSENGVERTWEALLAGGGDARAFGATRIAAIGPSTALALERHGLRADVVAKEYRGEGLAEEMLRAIAAQGPGGPRRVLLARAAKARDALPDALRDGGCVVDVVPAYETHPPPPSTVDALVRELEGRRIDAVTFTSSSTVDHLCDLVGPARAGPLLEGVLVASIGPITTETARARGLRVDVTADPFTVPGLVKALAAAWGR